ncbi:MAG: 50S ribosomal protein L17 [Candidatus Omnitrophica bacterium]|nr:50S ribosomal protein L17 [Candidatus Omnitrophota bacterium]
MRHRKSSKRLSRQSAHRKAVLRNQVKSLLVEERIKTTETLAKESRRLLAKLITFGKKDTLASRRQAFAVLADRSLVKLLFSEVAPRFSGRAGGYTRIVHLGNRRGDNASLVILEMTEMKKEDPKAKKPKKVKKTAAVKDVKKEVKESKEAKKEKTKDTQGAKATKAAKESKETKTSKDIKDDDKKGFLGGLRKFLKKDKDKVEKK